MSNGMRPPARQRTVVRPLTKGMFRDRPGQMIEPGGFRTLKNVRVTPQGVKRRPGFSNTANGDSHRTSYAGYPVGLAVNWQSGDDQVTLLVTDEMVFRVVADTGFELVPDIAHDVNDWASADGLTWTSATGNFVDANTDIDLVDADGDYFYADVLDELRKVSVVNSDTSITVASAISGSPHSSVSGYVYRSFRLSGTAFLPDWVYAYGSVYFASRYNYVRELYLDGATWKLRQLGASDTPSTIQGERWSAAAIGFFNERLWFGHIEEYDGTANFVEYRQRLRYSEAGSPANVGVSNYIDLDYTPGRIMRILAMGNLLAVYFSDTIYLGRTTNISDLPLVFDQMETGGIGLVGQRAVVPFRDGHFFVGQDNIYHLSTRGLEAVGTPILEQTIRQCDNPWRIIGCLDAPRNRVLFGFPQSDERIETVWAFNYLTNAWSYEEYTTWMVDSAYLSDLTTIDALSGTIDDLVGTIDDLSGEVTSEASSLFRDRSGGLLDIAVTTNTEDVDGVIDVVLETPDHDLDAAEMQKRFSRLSIKLEFEEDLPFASALDFGVEVSHNRGVTWKSVGTLRVKAGMDEGHCDFRLTSPHCRFRLTSNASVEPYWISEYAVTWTPSGYEGSLGTQEE